MKHFNNPKRTKWLAMLLAVLFGTLSCFGCLTVLFTFYMDLYEKPLKQVLTKQSAYLQKYYSAKIYNNYQKGKDYLQLTNMEYGIIKAGLEEVDYFNKDSYIYHSFVETKPNTASAKLTFYQDGHYFTSPERLIPSLTRHFTNLEHLDIVDIANNDLVNIRQEPIENVLYNKDNGVFYFETLTHCLPITDIAVSSDHVEKTSKAHNADLDEYESFSLKNYPAKPAYHSVSGNCKDLNTKSYKQWDSAYIGIGSTRFPFPFTSILSVPGEYLSSVIYDDQTTLCDTEITQDTGYPYSEIEYLEKESTSDSPQYYVISNIKKDVDTSGNDLFAKQKVFLTALYQYRYLSLLLTGFAGIGFLVSLYIACRSINVMAKTDTLTFSFWHKFPLLLLLILFCGLLIACAFTCTLLLKAILLGDLSGRIALSGIVLFTAAFLYLFILLLTNLAARYYGKVLWKYTISIHIRNAIQKIYQTFLTHTSLMLKGGCLFLLFAFAELFCLLLVMDCYQTDLLLTIWLLIMLVCAPIFFGCLIQLKLLQEGSKQLAEGNLKSKLNTSKMFWEFKKHGEYLNQIGDGMSIAVEERLRSERFKTELITNVSHDIKTPLTSIINYVDLLQKEGITDTERAEYLDVLNRQSARLKKLIEDLMEASKASTGNLTVNPEDCNIDILLTQIIGEFEEKFLSNQLELIVQKLPESIYIQADSRHIWRIFDNLMNNICKYAQPGTRVYVNQQHHNGMLHITFLNTSKYALNISGEELMERFVRGDASRNTEGSGLGLSIARSLAELMNGKLQLHVEGDLFKVVLSFPATDTQL